MNAKSKWLAALGLLALAVGPAAHAARPVLQRGYDAGVSGANLTETTLNTSNVVPGTFGLVFKMPVDDAVFAQPLYAPNIAIPNHGTHNVVYVATMSDTLYAFDADVGGAPIWSVNFASLIGKTPVPIANFAFANSRSIVGNLGILSTPVIDPSTNIMYLVACTLENGTMAYRLHAVDIRTGGEPYGPGVLITGSYGASTFNARYLTQRVSLALSNNQIVFGFGGMQTEYPNGYVGWVMAYDKRTLQQSGIFATEVTGNGGGGVWQSGRPPVVDSSGYVYVFAGNGYGGGYDGINNFGESALKLDPAKGLKLIDWFTAGNWSSLDANDLDLTSSGPLLIPGTNLLAGGGKSGDLYVLNINNLGKFNASDSQVVQKKHISAGEIRGGPVYWQRSAANGGPLLYDWGALDPVKAYAFNGTTLAASPSSQGSGAQLWPGGILALSANGEQHGSGVLWATVVTSGDAADNPPTGGALHALDAENVSHELWNSTINASRDGLGNFAKFVPPLVVSGKVYVATWSNQVVVYGLLSTYTVSPASLAFGSQLTNYASAPMSVTVTNTGVVALPITSITLSTPSPHPFSQTNTCGTSVAVGASCTISVVFSPAAAGLATATLSVNAGGSAGTQTVALSGTGIVPTYAVSPTSFAFGSQLANTASAPTSIRVTNTGAVSLPITGITLSTPSPHPFSQTNTCGTSVAVGASCTISVVFSPAAAGSATATLSVNAGGSAGTQTVALSGTGIVPTYAVSPTSFAFGSQLTNTASAPTSITVTNTGAVSLPITGITLSAPSPNPFSQTNTCGTSVAVGASCTISVVFNPTAAGSATATLSVNAAATTSTVSLSGSGSFNVDLTASSNSETVGAPVTLTWSSTPGAVCTASGGINGDNWAGELAASGSQSVSEATAGNYNYALNCLAGGVSATAAVMVTDTQPTVTVATNPPSSKGGGGGALDGISLLSLLTMIRLRRRGRAAVVACGH